MHNRRRTLQTQLQTFQTVVEQLCGGVKDLGSVNADLKQQVPTPLPPLCVCSGLCVSPATVLPPSKCYPVPVPVPLAFWCSPPP